MICCPRPFLTTWRLIWLWHSRSTTYTHAYKMFEWIQSLFCFLLFINTHRINHDIRTRVPSDMEKTQAADKCVQKTQIVWRKQNNWLFVLIVDTICGQTETITTFDKVISVKENCDCWKWSNSILLPFLREWSIRFVHRCLFLPFVCGKVTCVFVFFSD